VALHGRPSAVRVDYGPEFTAQAFVDWCAEHGVATHYIQPGKPDQNAYIERFNRSYRTEVLNAHLFESITELRAVTDQWARDLQPGAAPRQPRASAATHVSPEVSLLESPFALGCDPAPV
jgi:transposase InsO family protein